MNTKDTKEKYREILERDCRIVTVSIDSISTVIDLNQIRNQTLIELGKSIQKVGVLEPVSVCRISNENSNTRKKGYRYTLITGARRVMACKLIGATEIPAIILDTPDHKEILEEMMIRSVTKNICCVEEAEIIFRIINAYGITQDDVAEVLGVTQAAISNKIRLLQLSPAVRNLAKKANLSERHTRILLSSQDEEIQLKVIDETVQKKYSVKQMEKRLNSLMLDISGILSTEIRDEDISAKYVAKDIRNFIRRIKEDIADMKSAGVNAVAAQFDRGKYLEFIIRIPKKINRIK